MSGRLRAPDERKPVEAQRVNHRLEVTNERVEREVGIIPIGKTVTALIVVNEAMVLREFLGPVTPDGAFPAEERWLSQCAAHTSGGPSPTVPYAMRTSSEVAAKSHLAQGGTDRRPFRKGRSRD